VRTGHTDNVTAVTDEIADRVLEVNEFYEELSVHVESVFGRRHPRWVRGEIEKSYEKGHLYLDVVDATPGADGPRPVLKVRCWTSAWAPLKRDLAERGVVLKEGTVITFSGYTGIYRPRGEVSFVMTAVDVEGLLGDVARHRQALIDQLEKEGALGANRLLPVPPVPLRVGLVASPGTEGFNDFTGQLAGSGFRFDVVLARTTVQGESAPREIADALVSLNGQGVDVICVIRGGGSRGDLAAFDDEVVARAIVNSSVPVFTGIGHTGDTSVADLVAAHAAITPTKLGEHLADIVTQWRELHVVRPSIRIAQSAGATIDEATEYLGERRRTVSASVRGRLSAEGESLVHARSSLVRHAHHLTDTAARDLGARRQLLAAYDPQRRLAQGWSITTTATGTTVRSVDDVAVGDQLIVRVADGRLVTTVTNTDGGPHG
jgi:exodeoxyribonuclease VII large subunit